MQSKEPNTGAARVMNHPSPEEWMSFLYDEAAPQRKSEMRAHLEECPECARQVESWRGAQADLDSWVIPPVRESIGQHRVARLTWAAAAALFVLAAFAAGRLTSPARGELNEIKRSVAALATSVRKDSGAASNAVYMARIAGREEALRLFSEFAALQAQERQTERQDIEATLTDFDTRLGRIRSELETVAVNTYNGFEQTHRNLTRLASYSAPRSGNVRENN